MSAVDGHGESRRETKRARLSGGIIVGSNPYVVTGSEPRPKKARTLVALLSEHG